MDYKNTILLIIILVLIVVAYFVADNGISTPDIDNVQTSDVAQIIYCDENGNRYSSIEEAQAAGLTEAEYGATFCPEYVAAATGNYTGLTVVQAMEIAEVRNEIFRVIEIDGAPQVTTDDINIGRINASVENGIISGYYVESTNPAPPTIEASEPGIYDEIIGLTVTEAQVFTDENEIDFRTGSIDGEPMPVTMDYRPGRITAEIADNVVVGYTVE